MVDIFKRNEQLVSQVRHGRATIIYTYRREQIMQQSSYVLMCCYQIHLVYKLLQLKIGIVFPAPYWLVQPSKAPIGHRTEMSPPNSIVSLRLIVHLRALQAAIAAMTSHFLANNRHLL